MNALSVEMEKNFRDKSPRYSFDSPTQFVK